MKRTLDIEKTVTLALKNMYNSLDERRKYLPFFTYRLFDNPISLEHGDFDSPHVVGRYLFVFSLLEDLFDMEINIDIVKALKAHLFESIEIGQKSESGLAWNKNTGKQVEGAWGHNQREALLGLIGLYKLLKNEEALVKAHKLVEDIKAHMKGQGHFPGSFLTKDGWKNDKILNSPPAQSGRILGPLMILNRIRQDNTYLTLAHEIADYNIRNCFSKNGMLTSTAGSHMHSITGTITAILELGFFLGDEYLVTMAKKAFDTGLSKYRSRFGWAKEFRYTSHERGEANNSGDILESSLILAENGFPEYWDDAERILRNHLTASQLTEDSLFKADNICSETMDRIYEDVHKRAVGGFCFSSPSDFKSHKKDRAPINTDLVAGATRAICTAYKSSASCKESDLEINLLISKKYRHVLIDSNLYTDGTIKISTKEPYSIRLRIPRSMKKNSIITHINGKKQAPIIKYNYLIIPNTGANTEVIIKADMQKINDEEVLNNKQYKIDWIGDNVISVKGPTVYFHPLY